MTPLERPREYLDSVAVGIKIAEPTELPTILREVARNLLLLAGEAEIFLRPQPRVYEPEEPDDF